MPMVTSGVMRAGIEARAGELSNHRALAGRTMAGSRFLPLREGAIPRFVQPEGVKNPRPIPFAAEEIVPCRPEQGSLELLEAGRSRSKERGLDLFPERAAEPLAQRDGEAELRARQRLVELSREGVS